MPEKIEIDTGAATVDELFKFRAAIEAAMTSLGLTCVGGGTGFGGCDAEFAMAGGRFVHINVVVGYEEEE